MTDLAALEKKIDLLRAEVAELRDTKRLLTVSKAAKILGKCPKTITRWCQQGKIAHKTIGGIKYIPRSALFERG